MNQRKPSKEKKKQPPGNGYGADGPDQNGSGNLTLKSLYREMLEEPIPQQMLDLLDELEQQETESDSSRTKKE